MSELHTPVIEFEKVSTTKNGKQILSDINLTIQEREHWVFLGRNGAGKTTLVNYLFGYDWPTSGKISVLGMRLGEIPTSKIQSKIGMVQGDHQTNSLQKHLTTTEVLLTGFFHTIGLYREPSIEQVEKAKSILKENHLENLTDRKFHTLSSGEKQRILLLRAMVSNPEILVLDEPFANLDFAAKVEFSELLSEVHTKFKASILITHRVEEIPYFYTHICMLKQGNIIAKGLLKNTLTIQNLCQLYDLPENVIRKYLLVSL